MRITQTAEEFFLRLESFLLRAGKTIVQKEHIYQPTMFHAGTLQFVDGKKPSEIKKSFSFMTEQRFQLQDDSKAIQLCQEG